MKLSLAKDLELLPSQTANQVTNFEGNQTANQVNNFEGNQTGASSDFFQLDVSENGSIDAGLTLIPATIFFLILLQIILAGSWQVMERAKLHDLLIRDSISASTPTAAGSSFNKPNVNRSADTNQNADNETLITSKRTSEYGDIYEYESKKKVPLFSALLESLGVNDFAIKLSAVRVE